MIDDAVFQLGQRRTKPWLVLGKGPSLDDILPWHYERFHTFALNHACSLGAPGELTVAHFTDLEAYRACEQYIYFPTAVILPWVPHVNMTPGKFDLIDLISVYASLSYLAEEGRLWSYNSSRVHDRSRRALHLTDVRVRYFSAVAAFNLLGLAGFSAVHTLGVDGGKGYARCMDRANCLVNGQKSFDVQLVELRRAMKQHKLHWIRLYPERGITP